MVWLRGNLNWSLDGGKSPLTVRNEIHFGLLPLRYLGVSEDTNIPKEQRAAEGRAPSIQAVSSHYNVSGACCPSDMSALIKC